MLKAVIEERAGKTRTSYRVIWYTHGKRHAKTWDSRAKAELIEQVKGDAAAAQRALAQKVSTAPKLSEVAATYIERLIDVTPYTRTKYKTHLEMHLDVLEMPVDVITADDIARWVAWMQNEAPVRGAKKTGYSPKTIKNAHGFLSSVLSYAVKRGLRADNPAAGTRLPKLAPGDERDKFLTAEEFGVLLQHVAPEWCSAAVVMVLLSDMKKPPVECRRLRVRGRTTDLGVTPARFKSGAGRRFWLLLSCP